MTAAAIALPKLPELPTWAWAVIGLGAAWLLLRPKETGKALAQGAVQLAGGLVEGTVKGAGAVLGLPDTDAVKCAQAIADSNADPWSLSKALDVSVYCPAGTFLKEALFDLVPSAGAGTTTTSQPAPVSKPKYDPSKPPASVLDILYGPTFEQQSGCLLPGITCDYGPRSTTTPVQGFDLDTWIDEKNSQNRTITPVAGLRG